MKSIKTGLRVTLPLEMRRPMSTLGEKFKILKEADFSKVGTYRREEYIQKRRIL